VPGWRGLVGERARTAVYGWSERAFEDWSMWRRIFGLNVYIPSTPTKFSACCSTTPPITQSRGS
jgi:hypothetical protein